MITHTHKLSLRGNLQTAQDVGYTEIFWRELLHLVPSHKRSPAKESGKKVANKVTEASEKVSKR